MDWLFNVCRKAPGYAPFGWARWDSFVNWLSGWILRTFFKERVRLLRENQELKKKVRDLEWTLAFIRHMEKVHDIPASGALSALRDNSEKEK